MNLSTWMLFSGVAFVSIITPGPAVLLSVTNSLTHGIKRSVYSSLGNIFGILIVSSIAAMGLGAVLKSSVILFTVLKVFGAIYLIYLGIRQWWAEHSFFDTSFEERGSSIGGHKAFIQGLFVALSNPKAVLFFTALFPQFVDISKPVAFQFAVLTSTFMILSFLTLVFYAKSAVSFKGWFSNGNRGIWVNRISGMIFIAFGLGLLRLRHKAT